MNHILFSIRELAGVARVKFTRKKTAPANIFTAHADFELFFNDHASLISFGQELDRQFELFQEEMKTAMTDIREELYQNPPNAFENQTITNTLMNQWITVHVIY
jgi:hypothetical protein